MNIGLLSYDEFVLNELGGGSSLRILLDIFEKNLEISYRDKYNKYLCDYREYRINQILNEST